MAPDKSLMVLQSSSPSQKNLMKLSINPPSLSLSKTLFHPFPKAIWTFPLSQHLQRPGLKPGKLPFEELLCFPLSL